MAVVDTEKYRMIRRLYYCRRFESKTNCQTAFNVSRDTVKNIVKERLFLENEKNILRKSPFETYAGRKF